jgi:hypothetical protein
LTLSCQAAAWPLITAAAAESMVCRYGSYGLDAELSGCSVASGNLQAKGALANSSSAVWSGYQGNQQQQQVLQRPPASPPILRSDRWGCNARDACVTGGLLPVQLSPLCLRRCML